MSALVPVIKVDENKCVNCHNCISVCPVKYCIDGSGEKVSIRHELCIGCGSCIKGCTHNAREGIDDTVAFFAALSRREPMVAVVAPAIAARLDGAFLRLNGWLRQNGIQKIYDVSFGAELTVKSYEMHLQTAKPALVIAQPCPAIVNYIQIYQSDLVRYLAPADSPMLHTIKMLREWNPELRNHKIAVISPCVAKRREFDETGLGTYNVTIQRLLSAFEERKIDLAKFPEMDFDNPPAETAVLFSTPGGLKQTVERDFPALTGSIRKVEGPNTVYPYLAELGESIRSGSNPLILDCLNCEKGCNGGTGTGAEDVAVDILENRISRRRLVQQERLSGSKINPKKAAKTVRKSLEKFWKPGLYDRKYENREKALGLRIPDKNELKVIYTSMAKIKEDDFLNCAACGYNSCEMMATAIFNNLNKAENCHHYQAAMITASHDQLQETAVKLDRELNKTSELVAGLLGMLPKLDLKSKEEAAGLVQSTVTVTEMISSLKNTAELSGAGKKELERLDEGVKESGLSLEQSLRAIRETAGKMGGIHGMVADINKIAAQTNLLSMNAAIEAAHAGTAGEGFAVVAEEIRRLSEQASESSRKIGASLKEIAVGMNNASGLSDSAGKSVQNILARVVDTTNSLESIFLAMSSISSGTEQVNSALSSLGRSSNEVRAIYTDMERVIAGVAGEINEITRISRNNLNRQT